MGEILRRRDVDRLDYIPASSLNDAVPPLGRCRAGKGRAQKPRAASEALSALVEDLRMPNPDYVEEPTLPLIERNPTLFWRCLSILLFVINLILMYRLSRQ